MARPYTSGYRHGTSRIEAIIYQKVIAHRARVAGRNFAVSSKDVQNAFASTGHDEQHACLSARLRRGDLRLSQQSYRDARVVLQCADGELIVKPGCGDLQGTREAVDIFQDVYHPAVDSWLQLVEFLDFLVRNLCMRRNFRPLHHLLCRRCGQGQTFQRWARAPPVLSCGRHGPL